MKEFDRFSFPRNYSGKVPLFFRKFPEKFRRKFPEISELTTLTQTTVGEDSTQWILTSTFHKSPLPLVTDKKLKLKNVEIAHFKEQRER